MTHRMYFIMVSIVCTTLLTAPLFAQSTNPKKTTKRTKAQKSRKTTRKTKRLRLTPKQVVAQNAQTIATIDKNLPKRNFKWDSIVIHHTASEWSTVARIDAYHRQKFNDPDGIEYHFLIANGKRAPDGLIEMGRWPKQKRSIHLFKPKGYPASITISLVGNFHERKLRKAQYNALKALVIGLANRYNIPNTRITTHTKIDGRLTVCPGKHFPYKRLMRDIAAERQQSKITAPNK